MGTIRFEIRKDKIDKEGKAPIRLIYQVQGQRAYKNSGEKVYVENWDEKEQKAIYLQKGKLLQLETKEINSHLEELKLRIEKLEKKYEANEQVYSAATIIEAYDQEKKPATKKTESSKELYSFIDNYINDHSGMRVKGSLSVYRSLKAHLEGFEVKKRVKITFDNISRDFFQKFNNYLLSITHKDKAGNIVRTLNNVTIAKQMTTLKTFLNYAKANGIKIPEYSYKVKREAIDEVIALTRQEFEALYNLDLSERVAWDQVRDVFCFSCVTGLRYSDLAQMKWEHIKDEVIDLRAIKTSHKTIIPLTPFSRAILKKYKDEPRPLPVISNQKSNEHLAKIAAFADLNSQVEIVRKYGAERVATVYPKYELIRMHCGRKTFATLSLESGMSAEQVMKIGGWKDYKSFKRYINLTDESSKAAMEKAWGKVVGPKLKAV